MRQARRARCVRATCNAAPEPPVGGALRFTARIAAAVYAFALSYTLLGRLAGSSPFLSHAFLRLLEESGSVARERGWLPTHLVARDKGTGEVQGVAPMYLKGHSRGEYVFDQSWARFYEENGKQYYPKLQCAVPMTPVQGPRLLVREGAPEGTRRELARGMAWLCDQYDASSLHVTFCSQSDAAWLTGDGAGRGGPAQEMLLRTGMQYHWHNENALGEPYASFDEYLAALTQKRRNAVRKEMRQVARAGYTCRRLRGHEITPELWRRFFDFYLDTTERKWGQPYLTMGFFVGLSDALGDSALLVVAESGESGEIVAGALNVVGSDCIYGRNWGCAPGLRVNGLHMQVCYYEAIAAAIELGLARVEAGAQGDHKVARGYLPAPTYSAHYIRAPELRQPIAKAIAREREDLDEVRRSILSEASPFKAGCEPPRARKLLQDNLS